MRGSVNSATVRAKMAQTAEGLVDFIRALEAEAPAARQARAVASKFSELGWDTRRFQQLAARAFKIEDKNSNIMSLWGPLLVANPSQLRLAHMVLNDMEAGGQLRYLWLKNRKVGASTFMEMLILAMAIMVKGITCAIIAHTDESSNKLFSMVRNAYEHLPPDIKGKYPLRYNSQDRMQFGVKEQERIIAGDLGHVAQIKTQTAKGDYPLTGDTVRVLHMSECAKYDAVGDWAAQQRFILSAMGAVPKSGPSIVVAESTANGTGNSWFYNEWMRATDPNRRGEVAWKPVFMSWLQDASCAANVPHGYRWDKWYGEDAKTEDELREVFKATEEQLYFRRSIIQIEMSGNFELFDQEYPTTAEGAFLASGRPAVPRRYVKAMEATLSDEYDRYMARVVDGYNQSLNVTIEEGA